MMTDYSVHEPTFSGTTDDDPERYEDLNLPVVGPDGKLNENAIQTAYSGGHSVEQMDDIDDDTKSDAKDVLSDLADDFDDLHLDD